MERLGDSENEEIQHQVAIAMKNKGLMLGQQENRDEAIAEYSQLIECFGDSEDEDIQRQVALAMRNKGVELGRQAKWDEGIAEYSQLIECFGDSENEEIQHQVAIAMRNQGLMLGRQEKWDKVIAMHDQLIEHFDASQNKEIQREITSSMANLAELSVLFESKESSLSRIDMALSKLSNSDLGYSMMIWLKLVLEKASVDDVLAAIANLPENTKFTWGFDEIRTYLDRLEGLHKEQVLAFVRFYEEHHDIEQLKAELQREEAESPA